MVVFQHAGADHSAQLVVRNQVACLSFRGLVHEDALLACLELIVQHADHHETLCTIVHYDKATVLLSWFELFNITARFERVGLKVDSPIAFVVKPENFAQAQIHCQSLRRRGIWREAFCDRGDAEAWALDVSVLNSLQNEWRGQHAYA